MLNNNWFRRMIYLGMFDFDENGIVFNNVVQSKDAIYSPNGFYQDTYS